jgi:HAD superfamily hydrolase (TIGR01484 family)
VRYHTLATDYDGTLASAGRVAPQTLAALDRLRAAGWSLILVTGRELDDLFRVFPQADRFDRVVAENGALLYRPDRREERLLAQPPPKRFIDALRRKGVEPLSEGRVIVATLEPHERAVLESMREFGLQMDLVFNKGAVMALPAGVSKATGLKAALDDLNLSPAAAVGVGDAENDLSFLDLCGYAAAVSDALPSVKTKADFVTRGGAGSGVVELIDRLIAGGLRMPTRRRPLA